MRERVNVKSPVRENRPPGSVRGAPGNWRPYLDKREWTLGGRTRCVDCFALSAGFPQSAAAVKKRLFWSRCVAGA
jgi:hypothetical protein